MSRSNLATTQDRAPTYIIRGGVQGRERLRVLGRVMRPTTLALLERAGLRETMCCLDLGCGGGDVTLDLARIVGPHGRVVGIDMDEVKLEAARADAAAARLSNVEFRKADVMAGELPAGGFDIAYARFLLTHLTEPNRVVARMRDLLVPGGLLILEDIDYGGIFIHPSSWAHAAYVDLYRRAAEARGVDPDIGRRLPCMIEAAGLAAEDIHIVQPAGLRGDVKLLNPLTMEAIADAVVGAGLATRDRVEQIAEELFRLAEDEAVLMGTPRIVQTWGRKPG
jgi:ubiquinone/menaquinone biosynthesis C-methylase UbiE